MTRGQKKQIDNNKIAKMTISSFVASGTSDIVTPELVTAASANGVTVIPSNGTESSLGFIVTSSTNKVDIIDSTSKSHIPDINSNEVFGKLTESSGVYTLSYFSIQSGVETAVSLSQTIDFLPSYNFAFKDFPFDSAIRLDNSIFNSVAQAPSFLSVTADVTINQHFDIVEIDRTAGNIIITLGDISLGSIIKNKKMTFKVININSNTITFQGTASNFEDENIQIGNDPQLGILEIYASNANIWRTTGIL